MKTIRIKSFFYCIFNQNKIEVEENEREKLTYPIVYQILYLSFDIPYQLMHYEIVL